MVSPVVELLTARWFVALSDLRHAPVYKKFNAVDETAVVRREKHNHLGDFISCADATKRDCGDLEVHETLHLLFGESHQIVARSGHDTRTDGIDAYFALLEVKSPVACEGPHCCLRCAVNTECRRAFDRSGGRGEDNRRP